MKSDLERLKIFRAIRAEIRASSDCLVVGIDVAKEKHHAFFGSSRGKTLRKRYVFRNCRGDFESLRALARDLAAQHELSKVIYGLEPTGVYHKPLAEYLVAAGEHVVLVSNVAVQRNRELLDGRWDKNDAHDSANVADLIGQGRCLFVDAPEEGLRELRTLVRTRARLRKQEHALRMRIRNNLIAQYFPELEGAYSQGGNDHVVLRIVGRCFDPVEIAHLDFETFWERIALPRWGKRQEQRVRSVWQAARETVGCRMDAALRWQAPSLAQQLEAVRAEITECERRMSEASKRCPGYRSVISVPGIGPAVAAMVLAAIGDPNRFDHPRQVLRIAGFDLCASRSGKNSERVVPKISKQGKPMLRFALVQAARVAAHSNETVRAYFTKLLEGREQERGIRLKRTVKLAAKLLVIAWGLMKTNATFDPARFAPS
jgi:transposase